MAKKTAQANAAGFIEIQNKAIQPEQSKAPKKKADKKVEEVAVEEPAVQEPVAEEPIVASEPVSDTAEQFTRGFLVKNRRGFNPDARVKDADFAFRVLSDSVFTKGFLGRSLREDRGLPSVGIASARRAGVPVDDNGKMRCPPGTPNANQFTDINMSNCMVPSAETVAQEAADIAKQLASKAADGFKRGKHSKSPKDRDLIPKAGVGFADTDGFLQQKNVMEGVSVISPIDGSERKLNTVDDSIRHIAEGGALSDIPNTHVVRAITSNPERFEVIGTGGGIIGMTRMRDKKTGALIGMKYADTYSRTDIDAVREVASELFLEHMGYEPTPMRLVPNVRVNDNGTEEWAGLALITELAHNRNSGVIESARIDDRDGKYDYKVDPDGIVRMTLLDAVIQNQDRHEGNFMIARGENGQGEIIPIDHSYGLALSNDTIADATGREFSAALGTREISATGLEVELASLFDVSDRSKIEESVNKAQELLRDIDAEKLQQQIEELFQYLGGIGSAVNDRDKELILMGIQRLSTYGNPEETKAIAEKMIPEIKRNQITRLRDLAEGLIEEKPKVSVV